MPSTIIKNTRIVLPDRIVEGDLLVDGGVIAQIGGVIEGTGAEEIDGGGLHLMPGVIDSHVHFREPGLTHKESIGSGSAAALCGGVTAFLEMPNTRPPTVDSHRLAAKKALAAGSSWCHYGFYIGATLDNLEALKSAEGTPGIKIFVGSSTGNMLVDDQETLEAIFRDTSLPIAVHAEEESLVQRNFEATSASRDPATHSAVRTPEAAARSIARLRALAVAHQHRLHVLHVSSRAELEALSGGEGAPPAPMVTAEICYPHLFLDTDAYARLGCRAKINPALRDPLDREAMWPALLAGRFANVASDHAPHTIAEKERGYPEAPSGMPSVENGLALMLDAWHRGWLGAGDDGLVRLSNLLSRGPADVWGLVGKGRIEIGYDADLVLVDLDRTHTVHNDAQHTRAGWSAWDGERLTGCAVRTLVDGRTAMCDGQLIGDPSGRALRFRPPGG